MDTKMERDNDSWLRDLQSDGLAQRAALSDLRAILIRSLRGALATSGSINDSFLEDVVQDTLLLVLERLEQFEGRSKFLTWATSIAVRSAMTQLRRKRWKDVSLEQYLADQSGSSEILADHEHGPDEAHVRAALIGKMMAIINSDLSEKQRTVLIAELKGVPQDELAKHFGGNRNSIYKLTHDARKKLKTGLEADGYGAADIQLAFAN